MISSIIQGFFIKILFNIREQVKKRQRIYDLLNAESKSKKITEIIGVYNIHQVQTITPLITLHEAF